MNSAVQELAVVKVTLDGQHTICTVKTNSSLNEFLLKGKFLYCIGILFNIYIKIYLHIGRYLYT